MQAGLRELHIGGRIVFGSSAELELESGMIAELAIEEGAEAALLPGDVLSASCTLDLVNDHGQWLPGGEYLGGRELIGATIMPEICSGEMRRAMGVYQVESAMVLEGEGRLRLRAFDSAAYELGGEFLDELAYPVNLDTLWRHAVGQSRYSWNGNVPNGSAVIDAPPEWRDASLRAAMGWIAAAAGCFVRVDRSGSLELCPVNGGQEYALNSSVYFKLERECAAFGPVDSIRITPVGEDAAEKVYTGSAQTCLQALTVKNNPIFMAGSAHLDALAEGMLAAVEGYGSASLRFDWRGDPELRIGDRVLIYDLQGRLAEGVLSRQTMRFNGGFSASCACAIPESGGSGVRRAITPEGGLNAAALVGAVDGGLLSANSVTTAKLAAGSVTAEKLAAGAIDAQVIEAVTAKIGSLDAGDIQTDTLAAELARFGVITAGSADFDRATVGHLVANAMNLSFGVGNDVFIENLKVAYAQMVSAAIGNLCIKASDGNYYAIDVGADGCVKAVKTSVSGGEISAGQTASGRVILETEITASSLNTANLLATYALVNRIDAARIDVDELFAREAFIALLRTSNIVAGKSLTIIAGEVDEARDAAEAARQDAAAGYELAGEAIQRAGDAQDAADKAQNAAEEGVSRQEFQRAVRIDAAGLHVGDNLNASEVLIDSAAVRILVGGRSYSSFGPGHLQLGDDIRIRRPKGGGVAFSPIRR